MTTEKIYCYNCGKETDTKIEKLDEVFDVKGEQIAATIMIRICTLCGGEVWDEELERENEKIVYGLYREKKGLLSPEEIKATRTKIKISQTTFAKLLGLGEKTIARYENGALQESANDLLIRLMSDKENVRQAYNKFKTIFNASEQRKIEEFLRSKQIIWKNKFNKDIYNCVLMYETLSDSKGLVRNDYEDCISDGVSV